MSIIDLHIVLPMCLRPELPVTLICSITFSACLYGCYASKQIQILVLNLKLQQVLIEITVNNTFLKFKGAQWMTIG
jgi:hypothetical protein